MIVDLTTIWSGPYTATGAFILQPLGGAVMVSMGAGTPAGGTSPVIEGRLAIAEGQVFWARATDASVTARFYLGPTVQGAGVVVPPPVPANTAVPVITGTAQEGQTLSATTGSWTNSPTSYAYQWRRGGVAISGATAAGYTLVTADVGSTISVQVTASNAGGTSAPATSAATASVAAAAVAVPVNTGLPVITGTAQEGQTLSATTGSWTNSPTSYAYQWRRGGVAISGATASTYALVTADVGAAITVQVIASNAGGASAPAVSAATAVVIAAASAPEATFDFELLTETGSATITSVPNLRISVDGGANFFPLGAVPGHPGLTVARGADGKSLEIDGWAGGTVAASLRIHYEQAISGEPNSARAPLSPTLPALYFKRVGGPAPVNTSIPGMTVSATVATAPIGV